MTTLFTFFTTLIQHYNNDRADPAFLSHHLHRHHDRFLRGHPLHRRQELGTQGPILRLEQIHIHKAGVVASYVCS